MGGVDEALEDDVIDDRDVIVADVCRGGAPAGV